MLELTAGKVKGLEKEYGSSFYLLDSEQFKNNFLNLSEAFRRIYPNFNIAYSYKTNYTPKLCKMIDQMGGFAEVVSDMEMELALRIGVEPKKIIWNGPIKNSEKVKRLLLDGGTVNIDSIYELPVICQIAEENANRIINVGIRCNFDVGDGVISRFGFDIGSVEFDEALQMFKKHRNLKLINVQCHFAKRNVEFWPARAKGMVDIAKKVENVLGYLPDRIDIGGGLYGNMEDSLKAQFTTAIPSYEDYAKAAATVFAEYFHDAMPMLLVEPGSALVGDCMKFVGRVETIKTVRGKTYITLMGSQKNISMTGVNPPIKVIHTGKQQTMYEQADIVGYTCIEGDVLYHNYTGEMGIGDFVVFSNCGSYSLVMKPPFIMPNVPVLDICGDTVEVIKTQECFEDIFHTFSF